MSFDTEIRLVNSQLEELVRLLSEAQVRVWLESGTLLGVCRGGDVIAWDTDLDFGCWVDEEPRLNTLAKTLQRHGYSTGFERLAPGDDRPTTVVIRPPLRKKCRNNKRTATIAVYRRYAGRALRPAAHFTRSPRPRWSFRWLLDESIRFAIGKLWLKWRYPNTLSLQVLRMRLAAFTWSIPAHFFDEITLLDLGDAKVPVPAQWREYLSFRYGDWTVPDPEWDYYQDDGGVARQPFERLLTELGHD
jgi:hypothetical protein